MSPSILTIEEETVDKVDFVLLNVDNPRWKDLIKTYSVNGIPQFSSWYVYFFINTYNLNFGPVLL